MLDSTCFDCPDSLKDLFPSCGGDGSAANVKVLLRYELITGRLEPLHVLEGKRSDQGQALKAAERLLENQLQLQDKGFYDAKAWQAAEQRGAYLLMPLPHSVTLWLAGAADPMESQLDLAAALEVSLAKPGGMARAVSGKEGPSGRAATVGGFSAQPGERRTAPAGLARIHAHSRPNPFGQSAAIGRLALAADQCARPKASLLR